MSGLMLKPLRNVEIRHDTASLRWSSSLMMANKSNGLDRALGFLFGFEPEHRWQILTSHSLWSGLGSRTSDHWERRLGPGNRTLETWWTNNRTHLKRRENYLFLCVSPIDASFWRPSSWVLVVDSRNNVSDGSILWKTTFFIDVLPLLESSKKTKFISSPLVDRTGPQRRIPSQTHDKYSWLELGVGRVVLAVVALVVAVVATVVGGHRTDRKVNICRRVNRCHFRWSNNFDCNTHTHTNKIENFEI